jgi:hypothetical protein
MLCELNDSVVNALKALKGEFLQLNHYQHGNFSKNDGYVITSPSDYFFIKTHTKVIDNKYELHLLTIDQVWAGDVNEDILLETLEEGELSEIHIFCHSLRDLRIDGRQIEDITSECAFMLCFKDRPSHLIYPRYKLFGNSNIETDTDKILDIINALHLHESRII